MWDPDNTYIFIILGDNALTKLKTTNKKLACKYFNYRLSSFAILIKRLAIEHLKINEDHILILAKGEQNEFEINKILGNDKIFVQLGINEIYSTNTSQSEMNFVFFQNINQIHPQIQICLGNNQNANIILFLFDNNIQYLKLYLPFLKMQHHSLVIFNESCDCKSMIEKINNYYAVSEAIKTHNPNISVEEIFYLAKIAKTHYPDGDYNQFDKIFSLSKKFNDYFQSNQRSFLNLINQISFGKCELDINFSLDEIKWIKSFIILYVNLYDKYPFTYQKVHTIFQNCILVIQNAMKTLSCTNSQFLTILNELIKNDPEFTHNVYFKHPDHYIITGDNENGSLVTFPSIRFKRNIIEKEDCCEYKIIAGSPIMSAFIIEALIKSTPNQINIYKIKELVNGNPNGLIKEYAFDINEKISNKKPIEYIRPFINLWKSQTSPNEDIIYEHILDDDDETVFEIMKSINFDLVNYGDPELKNKKELVKENTLLEKERKTNYFVSRLAEIQNLKEYNYESEYYSSSNNNLNDLNNDYNNNDMNTNSGLNNEKDCIVSLKVSIDDLIACDEELSQQKIKQVREENKNLDDLDFSESILLIFIYELKKMTQNTDHQYSIQIQKIEPPNDIKCLFLRWVDHFFPTFDIQYHLEDIFSIFYGFVNHYRIRTKQSHCIFFKCMNVADQVVTPLHYEEKKSYIKGRLHVVDKFQHDNHDDYIYYDKFYHKYDDFFDEFIEDNDDYELKNAFNE